VRRDTWLARNSHALSTKYNILYNGGLALDAGVNQLKTTYGDNFWETLPVERMQPVPDPATTDPTAKPADSKTAGANNANNNAASKMPDAPKSLAGAKTGVSQMANKAIGAAASNTQLPMSVNGQSLNGQAAAGQTPAGRNANFDRAETKATKAIQKHSMNIGGKEKNTQMDEAHLMLGKARYYDQRFLPALEAFNYVLYKYPESSRINEVKVWREKTNMRLENDGMAITNLRKLLKDIKFKDQIFADANATLAQAFMNLQEKDSAIARLKLAVKFTRQNEEKARYRFIIGQLFEKEERKDSAFSYFQQVIDMNRSSPRMYVIQAHARQAAQFDFAHGDTLAFVKKFNKLLADRENRPYLDVLNHQMALFYDKQKNTDRALKYYNKSLDASQKDAYMNASNYRNIAEIYFNKAKYVKAGLYYDSTMVHLQPRTREFRLIQKKRENLEDVIKYEGIAQRNDSIINVWSMAQPARIAYYEEYIVRLKRDDELKRIAAEKERQKAANIAANGGANGMPKSSSAAFNGAATAAAGMPKNSKTAEFYFYNASTVSFGKSEFQKNWGKRSYQENWRFTKGGSNSKSQDEDNATEATTDEDKNAVAAKPKEAVVDKRYTTDFYISQLPKTQAEIDVLATDRNFAYYQLGVIYKEKFKEYQLAADKLEKLLKNDPEERLILPAKYNLYKIYEILNKDKAAVEMAEIIKEYPDSRYAQILGNTAPAGDAALTPEAAYDSLFREYENEDYKTVLPKLQAAVDQYTGEEMVPKFELLKARTVGKIQGLEEYKKALNYVSLTYPNSSEGKEAEKILSRDVVLMEYMQFNDSEPKSWKILYRAPDPEDKKIKVLQEKIKKFASERTADQLTQSLDMYTMDMNFVVIHGMKSEESAKGIASVLKEFKEYKITETPIIISTNNYEIVQIKKNIDEYLLDPHKVADKKAPPVFKPAEKEKDKPKVGARVQKAPPVAKPVSPGALNSKPGLPPAGTKTAPNDGGGFNQNTTATPVNSGTSQSKIPPGQRP
jgi:tetratricopeptide (TPR) repeat protein